MKNLFNLIKRAVVSRKTPDTGQVAVAQVSWNGIVADNVESLTPYGYSMRAPVGSTALMFNVLGQEENRAAIINNPKTRFKNLKEGEVAVGNPVTGSVVKFLENGDIDITCENDQNITVAGNVNLTVNGNVTSTITGNVLSTITGTLTTTVTGNTFLTSPVTQITGALNVTGQITAFYGLAGEINFTDIETKYNIHTHNETGTVTSVPNNTLP